MIEPVHHNQPALPIQLFAPKVNHFCCRDTLYSNASSQEKGICQCFWQWCQNRWSVFWSSLKNCFCKKPEPIAPIQAHPELYAVRERVRIAEAEVVETRARLEAAQRELVDADRIANAAWEDYERALAAERAVRTAENGPLRESRAATAEAYRVYRAIRDEHGNQDPEPALLVFLATYEAERGALDVHNEAVDRVLVPAREASRELFNRYRQVNFARLEAVGRRRQASDALLAAQNRLIEERGVLMRLERQ